jgi:transcriptional regulator of heat shock response
MSRRKQRASAPIERTPKTRKPAIRKRSSRAKALKKFRKSLNRIVADLTQELSSLFSKVRRYVRVQPKKKNLLVCETVSLGEKRFVAVVQFENERFLVGGSNASISLLSRLENVPAQPAFERLLEHELDLSRKVM